MDDEEARKKFEELVKKSTFPDEVAFDLSGDIASEEDSNRLMNAVYFHLKVIGASLELAGVEGITAADDYDGALANLDRGGFQTDAKPTATTSQFGSGAAMAVPVLRDGVVKTHIVLRLGLVKVLDDPTHQLHDTSLHILAHEAAHAHDYEVLARTVPEVLGKRLLNFREACLMPFAQSCWNEYIASYLSSTWGEGTTYCADMEPDLCSMLSTARERGSQCIFLSQMHQDKTKDEIEMRTKIYGPLLKRISNLIGHTCASNSPIAEAAPSFFKLVNTTQWFTPIFERFEKTLLDMHSTYGEWKSIDAFAPMMEICEDLLNAGGLSYIKLPNGNFLIRFDFPR